jgi:hypothetical protein
MSGVHSTLPDDSENESADEENDPDHTQPEQAFENEPHDRQHRPNHEQDDDHHPHTLRLRSSTLERPQHEQLTTQARAGNPTASARAIRPTGSAAACRSGATVHEHRRRRGHKPRLIGGRTHGQTPVLETASPGHFRLRTASTAICRSSGISDRAGRERPGVPGWRLRRGWPGNRPGDSLP